MKKIILSGVVAIAAVFSVTSIAKGQISEATNEGNIPVLYGHQFTTIVSFRYPFMNTSFQSHVGIGSTEAFKLPTVQIDSIELTGIGGGILFANLGFEYHQKVKEWLVFRLRTGLGARIGTEVQTFLTHGINTVTSTELGWQFLLKKHERYLLSASVVVQSSSASFTSIVGFIGDIINNVPHPSISRKVPALSTTGGVQFVYVLSPVLGLSAYADIGYGESLNRGEAGFGYDTGAALDFNFNDRYDLPLGVVLAYELALQNELSHEADESANIAWFKLAYTGAKDFSLGLDFYSGSIPLSNIDSRVTTNGFLLTSRFYFN